VRVVRLKPVFSASILYLPGNRYHKRVQAIAPSRLRSLFRRAEIGQRHLRIGDCAPRGVRNGPGDRPIGRLSRHRWVSITMQATTNETPNANATRHWTCDFFMICAPNTPTDSSGYFLSPA